MRTIQASLVALLAGFALGCAFVSVWGERPLAAVRSRPVPAAVNMAAEPAQPTAKPAAQPKKQPVKKEKQSVKSPSNASSVNSEKPSLKQSKAKPATKPAEPATAKKSATAVKSPSNASSVNSEKPTKPTARPCIRHQFTIDCQDFAKDEVLDTLGLMQFFNKSIKIKGFTADHWRIQGKMDMAQLSENVVLSRDEGKIYVATYIPFAKHYLKYLIKRYLAKQQSRDVVRIVSPTKTSLRLRYLSGSDVKVDDKESKAISK